MPLYNFVCTKCREVTRKLYTPEQFEVNKASTACKVCAGTTHHAGGNPSSQTMEVVGGDIQRRVERLSEAERIFIERDLAHRQKYGIKEEDEDEE
jgi:hypothetical protein